MGNAWGDNFSSARVTSHEMGLDQPDDDAEISLDKSAVEPGLDAGRCSSQVFMIIIPPGKMVGHGHGVEDPVASDQFTKLVPFIRPVETRSNENSDRIGRHSGLDQLFYQWSENKAVGYRPSNVADEDAATAAALRLITERFAVYRIRKGSLNSSLRDLRGRTWPFFGSA